jgi:hypothetical protein
MIKGKERQVLLKAGNTFMRQWAVSAVSTTKEVGGDPFLIKSHHASGLCPNKLFASALSTAQSRSRRSSFSASLLAFSSAVNFACFLFYFFNENENFDRV